MQRGNPNVWTVHNYKTCYQVRKVVFNCPLESVFNPLGTQPRAFFTGYATVEVANGVATLS